MRRGACVKCGYASVRCGRGTMYVGTHPSTNVARVIVPGQPVAGSVSSVIDVYLCTYCGYYEQYLAEPEALSFAATYWGPVEPT